MNKRNNYRPDLSPTADGYHRFHIQAGFSNKALCGKPLAVRQDGQGNRDYWNAAEPSKATCSNCLRIQERNQARVEKDWCRVEGGVIQ